jgi:hypothetical protein
VPPATRPGHQLQHNLVRQLAAGATVNDEIALALASEPIVE